MLVDLKRLTHLIALADECHFARAAERVHITQPAFSRSIQLLESQVGMRLFDRDSGEVKPTPAGLFLVDRARRLVFEARNLQRDTQFYRDAALGDTAFGAGPFPAATIMPRVVAELREQYPRVGLRVELNNWQLLCDRLLEEDIEFFVADVSDLPADPRILITPVGRQRGHVFARAGHPLAGRPAKLAQAWEYGVASIKWPARVKAAIGRLIGLAPGTAPALALECDDIALLRSVALSTDTVIAVSDAACQADLTSGALVRLALTDLPDLYAEMGVVALVDRTPSPMAQRAIGCVQRVAAGVNAAA
jgi:DNA-binding transcriptional LysR family regulator